MTPRQIFQELTKIAQFQTQGLTPFLVAKDINADELAEIQRRLTALLEKLHYEQAHEMLEAMRRRDVRRGAHAPMRIRFTSISDDNSVRWTLPPSPGMLRTVDDDPPDLL